MTAFFPYVSLLLRPHRLSLLSRDHLAISLACFAASQLPLFLSFFLSLFLLSLSTVLRT